jgi:hypothetical protein
MPKSWGGRLGRRFGVQVIMSDVTHRAAEMQLSIEVGSEPISGSVSVGGGNSEQFCGWIELVATIESARHTGSSGGGKTHGSLAGGGGGGSV